MLKGVTGKLIGFISWGQTEIFHWGDRSSIKGMLNMHDICNVRMFVHDAYAIWIIGQQGEAFFGERQTLTHLYPHQRIYKEEFLVNIVAGEILMRIIIWLCLGRMDVQSNRAVTSSCGKCLLQTIARPLGSFQ